MTVQESVWAQVAHESVESKLAWDQALRGALAAEPEKEEELVTTSLEFEYLHRKSRCEMLIGGDDISNDLSRDRLVSASRWLAEI